MRVRTFMAAAAALALFGYLAFRTIDLENRINALANQLGSLPEPAPASTDIAPKTASAPSPPSGVQRRLAAVEQEVQSLMAAVERLEKAERKGARVMDDKDVLSIVERENNRIKDVQLEWNRSRWLDTRDAQLLSFSKQYGLTTEQTAGLQKAMQQEIDGMIELLRRPDLLDDPDGTAADWQSKLEATDARAKQLLNPAQLGAWNQGRVFERKLLWPWLPSNLNK